ncbi:MAG: PQQ-binding-like beta-propeller repeat protein [Muribaculaceae bacterium]|nr:PQQ-binding-like beta-propeller repeat protein [Muribaculaceae bacterium]
MTDLHVSPGNTNEANLKKVVDEINNLDYDMVIVSGDLTNTGSDEELLNVKKILDKINRQIYIVPGNHENNWSQSAGATYKKLFGDDRFKAKIDDILLIGINCGPYMKMGNGHIKREDLAWLDKELSQTDAKRVISINHYPLNADLDMYDEYTALLHEHPVITHLCGHYHQFKKYKAGEIECLVNRALDMKNNDYGYTIIEITNDSIKQWDKQIHRSPILKNKIKINANHNPYIKDYETLSSTKYVCKIYDDSASIFTIPSYDNGNIYIGNSLGIIKCIDIKSGKIKWEYQTGGSLHSRPIIAGKYVVVPTTDNRLLWINKKSGKLISESYARGPYVADGIVVNNELFIGGSNSFSAWDVKKRNMIWEISVNNYCQASPTADDSQVVFGAWDTKLRLVDTATGNIKWDWSEPTKSTFFSPGNVVPVMTEDKIFIVAPDRYMTALNRKTGEIIWRNNSHKYRESIGRSADYKTIYAKTMDGEIIAVSATENEFIELWKVDTGFGYEHAPCIVIENNGIVYAGSIKGEVAAINPITHELLWRSKVGNSEINGWTVTDNGDLIFTLIEGSIWKINQ